MTHLFKENRASLRRALRQFFSVPFSSASLQIKIIRAWFWVTAQLRQGKRRVWVAPSTDYTSEFSLLPPLNFACRLLPLALSACQVSLSLAHSLSFSPSSSSKQREKLLYSRYSKVDQRNTASNYSCPSLPVFRVGVFENCSQENPPGYVLPSQDFSQASGNVPD